MRLRSFKLESSGCVTSASLLFVFRFDSPPHKLPPVLNSVAWRRNEFVDRRDRRFLDVLFYLGPRCVTNYVSTSHKSGALRASLTHNQYENWIDTDKSYLKYYEGGI
ncbi:hypothetical protein EVAR_57596_1 [Eumeta japonica]|uniref:Uncharacterized protein n=1 Tax=Eumeta variegata TaxID=151549 RepID=A0A4C1XYG5_EUMVA|nr:hypothetical protein EVAR_57596_1 [Eumeta japonica]